MKAQPVGTAIAENPGLSILGAALKQANLLESLDRAPALTVFAPTDEAFEKMSVARLSALRKDREAMARELAEHIVTGRLEPEEIPGAHRTLGDTEITIKAGDRTVTVNGVATILCANVQTTNAIVYIIDAVLDEN